LKPSEKTGKNKSTQHELVKVSTNFPRVKLEMADLEEEDLEQLLRCIDKIKTMTWQQIYNTASKGPNKRGLNWEPLEQKTRAGCTIATIRITRKFRARVSRRDEFMIFISLHPDHDSAYNELGGEDL
jgi:hypothetical protein